MENFVALQHCKECLLYRFEGIFFAKIQRPFCVYKVMLRCLSSTRFYCSLSTHSDAVGVSIFRCIDFDARLQTHKLKIVFFYIDISNVVKLMTSVLQVGQGKVVHCVFDIHTYNVHFN